MPNITIVDLGYERIDEFQRGLERLVPSANFNTRHYQELDPSETTEISDILVLSPGSAKVGLATASRVERDPYVPITQLLVQNAVHDRIPILGVNAGHELLNTAYNHAIDKVGDDYHEESKISLQNVKDTITEGIDKLTLTLTNNYGVLPLKKQKRRFGQGKINQLVGYKGFALI